MHVWHSEYVSKNVNGRKKTIKNTAHTHKERNDPNRLQNLNSRERERELVILLYRNIWTEFWIQSYRTTISVPFHVSAPRNKRKEFGFFTPVTFFSPPKCNWLWCAAVCICCSGPAISFSISTVESRLSSALMENHLKDMEGKYNHNEMCEGLTMWRTSWKRSALHPRCWNGRL